MSATVEEMVSRTTAILHEYEQFMAQVMVELGGATVTFPPMVSAHEGFAILKEEVDELWDAVRMKQYDPKRPDAIRAEAVQVAAMALRFLHDVCGDVK